MEPRSLLQGLQFLAGLEPNSLARRDGNFGSRAGVPADARLARPDIENPKAAQFDPLPLGKRPLHALENRFHRHLGLGLGDSGLVNYFVDNI